MGQILARGGAATAHAGVVVAGTSELVDATGHLVVVGDRWVIRRLLATLRENASTVRSRPATRRVMK